ncbi:MAG: class I SAM-dependent methyltransferase [Candidatus Bathyarchaeota archaeon]|jgi:cyclopropane fatty-acyl-phospholipid synthase-like methyltransferase
MSYSQGAEKFYDLFGEKEDAPFYIDLAHQHGDRALELGVGTARLAISLARAGVETWGVDNSRHMLKAAEANLSRETTEVRGRVHLEYADVRDFNLGETFGLVYFPSTSFDHILEREEQISALKAISEHIAPGGVYAFEIFNVQEVEEDSNWFVQRETLDEERTVIRLGHHRTDPETQLMTVNLWYEVYRDGRMTERYHEAGEVYVHTPENIKGLLDEAGYEIESVFGDHERREFNPESELMVLVTCPL